MAPTTVQVAEDIGREFAKHDRSIMDAVNELRRVLKRDPSEEEAAACHIAFIDEDDKNFSIP